MTQYRVPQDWNSLTLGQLTESTRPICYGVLKPGESDDQGVPLIRVTDISSNQFDDSHLMRIKPSLDEEFRRSRLKGGELLLSIQGTIGRVAICPERYFGANVSRTIAVIDPDARVDRRFTYFFLRYLGETSAFHTVGTTRSSLNIETLRQVTVPIPPLSEQRRIAEILERADALVTKRRAALAKLATLTQSILLDMFGDPATNPKGWPVVSIADVCEVKGGKRLPKGEEYSTVPTPFRYIRIVDLKAGRVDESALVYLKPEMQAEIARYVVNKGDVIISIAGSIGLVAPVPESLDGVNLTENAAKLVPRGSGQYEAEYLARFLETDYAQGQIASHIGQVTIGKLALFRIEKLKVPLPPIDLQRAFTRRLGAVASLTLEEREGQLRLEDLLASLQHRAFRGEL